MKRIYVSLPISGYIINQRKEYAYQVKRELECEHYAGWGYFKNEDGIQIVTPFDVCPEAGKPYSYYMGKDIEALLECDTVYFCKGWQNSDGCMLEFAAAKIYGKEIIFK